MKQVKIPDDIPNGKHYLVIEFTKVTESSGWGTENDTRVLAPTIYVTDNHDDWLQHIGAMVKGRNAYHEQVPYVALKVEGKAKIETQIKVA